MFDVERKSARRRSAFASCSKTAWTIKNKILNFVHLEASIPNIGGAMNEISRRSLLKGGGMIAVGLVTPRWLAGIAQADALRVATGSKAASDTVLVVCQLTGGNDGLNTVIPYANKLYYDYRPQLALPEKDVLKISNDLGFHPALKG